MISVSSPIQRRDGVSTPSTMAPGVRAALAAVFRAKTGAGEADAWLAGLRASGRYLEDIWGETAVV